MDERLWEFTGETRTEDGVTLRRIRARVAFTLDGVEIAAGEEGGWIETENNLSDNAWVSGNARVYGDAWVSGNARVSGNAWVYGNARVCGNAWVSDNACVFGNARVRGDARVGGNAWVCGNARVSGNARVCGNARVSGDAHYLTIGPIGSRNDTTTFTRDANGVIHAVCGCFYGTLAEFRAKVKETHGDNEHARAYRAAADLAEMRLGTAPADESKGRAIWLRWRGKR